ncbi:MAG: transketolase [Desulfovibrio sp.]|uniref:transketolase n=1 Tax=Desulfovibrio sp. 7SRBS1 TaxID=3378064 RepID=UPI003B3FB767
MDQQIVNTVKGLIMDATRQANSGHPGGAMSSADYATILFKEFLKFDPDNPNWFDRDRFVLSAGHESMLLYGLLHLNGWLGMDEIKNFRQLGSKTPGHPEHDMTPGVEATTGPLGQGLAMSVGMAVAEAKLRDTLGQDICNHHTYVLAGDGDFQEGISFGAATLAGVWGLGKLIAYYDSNKVQLAGPTTRADCTDYRKIYEGICWHVIEIDGHNHDEIRKAIREAQAETSKPTLIIGHTTMANGTATREGDYNTHGAPLPPEEIAASKKKLGLAEDKFFQVGDDVVAAYRARFPQLADVSSQWSKRLSDKLSADASFNDAWQWANKKREDLTFNWPEFPPGEKVATRKAWGSALNALIDQLPTLVGGSADLDPSNQTVNFRDTTGNFSAATPEGRNLAWGVREFPMGVICNGIALHGGLIPFGATFLTFSDYMRNALRMSALQKLPVLNIYTHDSFYLGEDGPTHQSIEHVSSLRLIPNMLVMRPADANETCACLELALRQPETPSCIMLTRQGLPVMDFAEYPALEDGPAKGGYVLKDCEGTPDAVIVASGSEVSLAIEAAALLEGKAVRVVSMPCMELFDAQDEAYKSSVIPDSAKVLAAAEAGRPDLWHKYVGKNGVILGISHFGHSAPSNVLAEKYGFTAENLAAMIREKF